MRLEAVWFQHEVPYRVTPHSHDIYEFHYIARGKARFHAGNRTTNVEHGHFFFTPPGETHHILLPSPAVEAEAASQYLIWVRLEEGDGQLETLIETTFAVNRLFFVGLFKRLFFEQLRHRIRSSEFSRQAAQYQFLALLYDCASHLHPSAHTSGSPEVVESALGLLQSSLHRRLTVDELCEKVAMSRSHFIRTFTRYVGIPPMRYHLRLKIEQARLLLGQTSERIGAIARRLGFEDQLYFSRLFKRYTGMSPRLYRKRHGVGMASDG